MAMTNADIGDALLRIADLLEIQGENVFRVRAYRNAARTIAALPDSAASMLERGEDLSELPGIGKDLAGKIADLVRTGHVAVLDQLARRVPGDLAEMLRLPGLGPKRVSALHKELGIQTLAGLKAAAAAGKLQALRGFGEKTEARILQALEHARPEKRVRLAAAEQVAAPLLAYLKADSSVTAGDIAGSYRRRRETVGDLDVLVACEDGASIVERFAGYEEVARVTARGPTRAAVVLRDNLQVDLRVVPEECYGAALLYFTGSKAHNIAIRKLAVAKKLKLSEYGLFRGTRRIAGRTENEVYRAIGLSWVPPELREDRGEVEAALHHRVPHLVETTHIRGDLHAHTDATDGRNTLAEMAEAARKRGYEYVAITDHTRAVAFAHGLDARRLARQIDAIDSLNAGMRGFRILKSAEVDILEDGKLDLPDDILKELDFTVCSIHSHFALPESEQTERVLRAMDNRYFSIFGHPTGRLLGEREPYAVDLERLMRAALERGCYFEVNAQPERLDLNDVHCRLAGEMGMKVAISTDAHRTTDFDMMRFGVDQARRGWLAPSDVLNTRSAPELRALLRRA